MTRESCNVSRNVGRLVSGFTAVTTEKLWLSETVWSMRTANRPFEPGVSEIRSCWRDPADRQRDVFQDLERHGIEAAEVRGQGAQIGSVSRRLPTNDCRLLPDERSVTVL